MRRNDYIYNLLMTIMFILILILNNFIVKGILSQKIVLDLIVGLLFIIGSFLKLKNVKNCFRSIEFIYGFCFFIYSIVGCLVFTLDNYSPRFYFFKINPKILSDTLEIYISALCYYGIFCFSLNRIKIINFDSKIEKEFNNIKKENKMFTLFNLIALYASISNLVKIFMYGSSFFSLSTAAKRQVINSGISHYINLFMLVYSLFITLIMISKNRNNEFKKDFKNKTYIISLFLVILYWGICLTCERRFFVTFLIGFVFIVLYKFSKIKLKNIIIAFAVIIVLLFSAAFRDNISLKTHSLADVIYSSTTEFYCTFMISDAYVYYKHDLLYGSTYIVDTISKLIPKSIFPNKPEDLSVQFMNEYKTNVGFAFNPIAESILNFGKFFAPIATAIVMLIICFIANNMLKKNVLYYIILVTFSLDFHRGAFSNVAFDFIFCSLLIYLLFKVTYGKEN